MALRSRLYLGDDHLLHVESSGYTERYHRFYYRDVYAVSLQRTRAYALAGVLLATLGALVAVGIITAVGPSGTARLAIFCLAVCLAPLAYHLALGPTCICVLHTAAHHTRIRSLGRIRRARRALDLIRPRIEAAQGVMDDDQMSAELAEYDARILQGRAV